MSRSDSFVGGVGGVLAVTALLLGGASLAYAEANAELEALSLEELMNIQVTSVSKRPQKVIQTPAAISVITREDIRRSGHTNIPDLLRMVPGASVGRYTPKSWAVGIRGDEAQFSRMLLVLVDGRAAFTTAFNGTFWDELDMPMEDIERIEVIRGPGASVWGANAVHGVINIIRRRPEDSESYATGIWGSEDRIGSFGYTGNVGEGFNFRASSRYVWRDGFAGRTSNETQRDGMRNLATTFRGDLAIAEDKTLTLQGDWYGGSRTGPHGRNLTTTTPYFQTFETTSVRGGNLLTRLELRHSETATTELQLYFDDRLHDLLTVSDDRQIYDFELRSRLRLGTRNDFNWGAGARHISERIGGTLNFFATPEKQDEAIYNFYMQNEFSAIPNVLSLTAGSKFEWNTYTGWEVQPTVRALWAPLEHQQFWAAVSRAVRIPSRQDIGEYFNSPAYIAPLGIPFAFQGTEDHTSEVVVEYDLGWRWQASETLNLDVTAFVQRTQNFQVFVPNATVPTILNQNDISERSSAGAEAQVRWRPVDYWNLVLNYTRIHIDHSGNFFSLSGDHSSPESQVGVFSYLDLPGNFELDLMYYYHGPFGTNDNTSVSTEFNGYHKADVRLGWHPTERLELSIVGQNLLDHRHREGLDFFEGSQALTGQPPSEVERALYFRAGFTF
jgi:iron complex outermembrane recepter protein